ncbi:MAG TPA: hypothetical protein VK736_10280 [Candidatus Binatia bacterium]|nr:hypothetical protein [Candidatus Binatia bacterium]
MTSEPTVAKPDVIIIGCVSSKRSGPAMAKDLYASPMFVRRRRYAEATGKPWFIYSAARARPSSRLCRRRSTSS